MSYEEDRLDTPASEQGVAASRVSAPSILLIIVGVLNLLGALYAGFNLIVAVVTPVEQFATQQEMTMDFMKKIMPGASKELEKQPKQDPQQLKNQGIMFNGVWLVLLVGLAIVPLIGGIRMRQLRGYGLAMTAAIFALFPCLDPGCCLIIGPVAGIWTLVVLSNADVKAAFH
jgi:hypothetical protein